MKNHNQSFEIDLLPIISLLAVCISFLLLTSVWVHIGSIGISQAVGTSSDQKVQPSIKVELINQDIQIQVKDSKSFSQRPFTVRSVNSHFDMSKLKEVASLIREKDPSLKMALIFPKSSSRYQDLIEIIDTFKGQGITDVGIAPL